MYASRVTPVQRMRGSDSSTRDVGARRRHSSTSPTMPTTCMSPSKNSTRSSNSFRSEPSYFRFDKRPTHDRTSSCSTSSSSAILRDGDYQVLQASVVKERSKVHDARQQLATKLDQLGEHHVRRKEYDNAMDAFAEALREKRSVFWNIGNCNVHNLPAMENNTTKSHEDCHRNATATASTSSFSSSLLSGVSTGNSNNHSSETSEVDMTQEQESRTDVEDTPSSSSMQQQQQQIQQHAKIHDATIDALVHTLRNIGNVHSLRGEQDEAMRYFTEVTTLRAQKIDGGYATACQDADDASVETRSFLSGLTSTLENNGNHSSSILGGSSAAATMTSAATVTTPSNNANITTGGDENSALMSEINEDIKALDDLFNSISFRQGSVTTGTSTPTTSATATPVSASTAEKRKSRSSSRRSKKHKHHSGANDSMDISRKQTAESTDATNDEPFHRESSSATSDKRCKPQSQTTAGTTAHHEIFATSLSSPSSSYHNSSAALAIDKYKAALEYLRHDIRITDTSRLEHHQEKINSFALQIDLQLTQNHSNQETQKQSATMPSSETRADLEMALEIYKQILKAYKESSFDNDPCDGRSNSSNSDWDLLESSSSSIVSSTKKAGVTGCPSQKSGSSLSVSSSTSSSSTRRERQKELAAQVASVLICTGSVYYKLGHRTKELEAYKHAKNVYSKAFGEHHVFVAGTRKNIGMVLAERGQYDLAQRQFEKAMSIYVYQNKKWQQRQKEHQQQPDHGDMDLSPSTHSIQHEKEMASMNRDIASVISCIGNVKNRVGELDAALTKYLQALRIYKSLYEHHHPNNGNKMQSVSNVEALRDVTSTLKVIGMVHAKKGDLDTAMQFFQEAMELLRHHEKSIADAFVPPSISSSSESTDNEEKSSANFAINENAMATSYSVIRETKASVLSRVASIHLKKGELDEAMVSYREAYDLTVQNRGNTTNHPEIAGILHYIGGIYHKRG